MQVYYYILIWIQLLSQCLSSLSHLRSLVLSTYAYESVSLIRLVSYLVFIATYVLRFAVLQCRCLRGAILAPDRFDLLVLLASTLVLE